MDLPCPDPERGHGARHGADHGHPAYVGRDAGVLSQGFTLTNQDGIAVQSGAIGLMVGSRPSPASTD
ncbi:hypothetical protein [Intrasporangium sp.]|uniref:hypothetical protein n=1 Tax=Intrasporangium sp. TaxID=1925024 RepID=UPI00293A826C|nr:hypothetical protein [Intrasporangium sp.]MDV3223001.1 hypothetical protein [Intrasporangium sp.]